MDQRQDIVGKVRPAQQLVHRAAQHEREVGRLLPAAPASPDGSTRGGGHDSGTGASWALAAATTLSTVKPYSFSSAFNGAEAPKVCMPMTRPVGPT